ncbi:Putative transport protein sgaT [Streptococcus pyogenes M1 476]|nr:Putative transport protein sgaT [Streptococcus pyogenes M1 476]
MCGILPLCANRCYHRFCVKFRWWLTWDVDFRSCRWCPDYPRYGASFLLRCNSRDFWKFNRWSSRCDDWCFANGLLLAFLPAMLLPVLGKLGFSNTTFGDVDFGVLGILLGRLGTSIGQIGIYLVVAVLAIVLVLPNFLSKSQEAINNVSVEI